MTTISLSDLEKVIRSKGTLAVNIIFDGEFKVHVRDSNEVGFTCAQLRHASLASALSEHFAPQLQIDLLDGL